MPAPRGAAGTAPPPVPDLPVVPARQPNALIGLGAYYRSAGLLLRQVREWREKRRDGGRDVPGTRQPVFSTLSPPLFCFSFHGQAALYRAAGDDLQLYTMLLRYASLVVETIPAHAAFKAGKGRADPQYRGATATLADAVFPELERIKAGLRLASAAAAVAAAGVAAAPRARPPGTLRADALADPAGVDWGGGGGVRAGAVPPAQPHPARAPLPPGVAFDLLTGEGGVAAAVAAPPPPPPPPPALTRPPSASAGARARHSLLGTAARSPEPFPPPSSIYRRPGSASYPPAAAIAAATAPWPEPMLGPQAAEVVTLPPGGGPPFAGGCSHAAPPPPPPPPPPSSSALMVPALGVDPPGAAPASPLPGLREVHVSAALLDDFLRIAAANTARGVETCGILAGVLSNANGTPTSGIDGGSVFTITTLIIPKQKGTSDTVQAEAEEEIFAAQDERSLFPLGWVHTHPAQACFLSSVDVHTQCGYQMMLDEAIAAVMAPRDVTGRRCGLFRLSTPEGLALVRDCPARGFHAHPRPPGRAGTIYELCGHVYLNPRVGHQVVDLR